MIIKTQRLILLLTAFFVVLLTAATLATRWTRASPGTLYVSTDPTCAGHDPCYTNVQDALDAAQSFDDILVATGTYTDLAGTVAEIAKTITLQGGWNAGFIDRNHNLYPTTLDAQGNGRVIYISGTLSPTIDGFIITGGNTGETVPPDKGGGIYSECASPIIVNNIITNNIASTSNVNMGYGGGLYLDRASASTVVSGNQILSNTASVGFYGWGGGLYLLSSDATVSGNTISGNIASTANQGFGGGLYLLHSAATISGNIISGNTASTAAYGQGGGLYLYSSDATLSGNTISGNTARTGAGGDGGGLWLYNSKATLDGNRIISNTAYSGGGLGVSASAPFTLTNNIIAQNKADTLASGMKFWGWSGGPASGKLINNTIAQNNLGSGGEGVYANSVTTLTLTNNIVVSHTYGIYADAGATVAADYTLFFDNSNDTWGPGTIITGTNTITGQNPLLDVNWHLQRGSPAIDAGTTVLWLTTDIDGDPRPIGAGYDIGADEFAVYIYFPLIMKNY